LKNSPTKSEDSSVLDADDYELKERITLSITVRLDYKGVSHPVTIFCFFCGQLSLRLARVVLSVLPSHEEVYR